MKPTHSFDFEALELTLEESSDTAAFVQAVVNAPFQQPVQAASIFLGIVVLLLVDPKAGTINRIALTNNEHAERAKRKSAKEFEAIKIPLGYPENTIAQAIANNEPRATIDWQYLFVPDLTPQEAWFNQADAGIGYSAVYPLQVPNGGALIFSYYQQPDKIQESHHEFMAQYAALVSKYFTKLSSQ